jgi:hypothetical protein
MAEIFCKVWNQYFADEAHWYGNILNGIDFKLVPGEIDAGDIQNIYATICFFESSLRVPFEL